MAFQVSDYHDLVQLLWQRPEWREELRHLLLTPEVLSLPQVVQELAEAQKRSEERLTRLEQVVAELAEAQKRSEERLSGVEERLSGVEERLSGVEERLTRLEQVVAELAEAQKRTEQRVEELAQAQEKTEQSIQKLTRRVDRLSGEVGNLRGEVLEVRYRQRPFSFFGRLLSRAQVVDLQEIWPLLEERLRVEEVEDLLLLDMLVRGQPRPALAAPAEMSELWLAVEISGVADVRDVQRASRRAELLRRAGLMAVAVVAGNEWTAKAEKEAQKEGVVLQADGVMKYQEAALRRLQEMG